MTPQESVATYESWCAANKSMRLVWKENSQVKTFDAHLPETIAQKLLEIVPLADKLPTNAITVNFYDSVPTFEGYKEWLQYQ